MGLLLLRNFPRIIHRDILQDPSEKLRAKSEVVKDGEDVSDIVVRLIGVARDVDRQLLLWLGMAAPQVGLNKQVFILKRAYGIYETYINPQITKKRFEVFLPEACFSVQGLHLVRRYLYVKVRYETKDREVKEHSFFGGIAMVVQQEIDHLNGKLING